MRTSFFAPFFLAASLLTGLSAGALAATISPPPADQSAPAGAAPMAKKVIKKTKVTCAKSFTLVKGTCTPDKPKTMTAPAEPAVPSDAKMKPKKAITTKLPVETAVAPADTTAPADPKMTKPAAAKKPMKKKMAIAKPDAAAPVDAATAPADATMAKSTDAKAADVRPADAKKVMKKKMLVKTPDSTTPAEPPASMTKSKPVQVTCAEGYTLQKNKCVEVTVPTPKPKAAMAKPDAKKMAKPADAAMKSKNAMKKSAAAMTKPKEAMTEPADVAAKPADAMKKPVAMKKAKTKVPVKVTCAKDLVLQNGKCIAAEAAVTQ